MAVTRAHSPPDPINLPPCTYTYIILYTSITVCIIDVDDDNEPVPPDHEVGTMEIFKY